MAKVIRTGGVIGLMSLMLLTSGFFAGKMLYKINHGTDFLTEAVIFAVITISMIVFIILNYKSEQR